MHSLGGTVVGLCFDMWALMKTCTKSRRTLACDAVNHGKRVVNIIIDIAMLMIIIVICASYFRLETRTCASTFFFKQFSLHSTQALQPAHKQATIQSKRRRPIRKRKPEENTTTKKVLETTRSLVFYFSPHVTMIIVCHVNVTCVSCQMCFFDRPFGRVCRRR